MTPLRLSTKLEPVRSVFILAGEPSGDLYAGLVAQALRALDPTVQISGVGGAQMKTAGVELVEGIAQLGMFGFTVSIHNIHRVRQFTKRIRSWLRTIRPQVFIPVSFAGVNLQLARYAHSLGIRVVYLSPPQLWAWGGWRVRPLHRYCDQIVCLLPFEPDFLAARGVKALYLGNPLVDLLADYLSGVSVKKCAGTGRQVVLMPGSRKSEVARHLPLMIRIGQRLNQTLPELRIRILFPDRDNCPASAALASSRMSPPMEILTTTPTDRYLIMSQSELIIAASGTVTLETALLQIPLIVLYKLTALNYLAARILCRLRHFSLPNLILHPPVACQGIRHDPHQSGIPVPEFLQPSIEQVSETAYQILTDPEIRRRLYNTLTQVRLKMGKPGAAQRIAQLIVNQYVTR